MNTKKQETILFKESLPDGNDYWELFQTTGWNQRYNFSALDLSNAIRNSWYAISIYESTQLIGFGRVIADGVHHALIVDIIIHPEFQNRGLGSKLLDKLVAKCKDCKIRDVQLFSAKDKHPFYEKFGFVVRPNDAPGMQLIPNYPLTER
jgi:ribosomal protein S18 acetylase RimI-like enzyme